MRGAMLLQIGSAQPDTVAALAACLSSISLPVQRVLALPPDRCPLEAALRRAAAQEDTAVILTLGATGPRPGHTAPDALAAVVTQTLPGLSAALSAALPPAQAQLFRGMAGLRSGVLLANLPPPPFAQDALLAILPGIAAFVSAP